MYAEQISIMLECINAHVHGFYTCADVGVEPDMNAFIINVFESIEEYEDHPSLFEVSRYIEAHWIQIRRDMIAE